MAAGEERARRSQGFLHLLPATDEEVARLSDEEKRMLIKKIRAQYDFILEARKEVDLIAQEEPIPPPENN